MAQLLEMTYERWIFYRQARQGRQENLEILAYLSSGGSILCFCTVAKKALKSNLAESY
ncbi:MAG: hypothetical protein Q8L87_09685 [Anaerolineales bacterium]|nr:hypothetical protein [Anaerolineales bacterium]